MSNLPTTIQDSIKERIKSIVGELIPEETYNTIVTATVKEFMTVDLPKLVKDELTAEYKKLIAAEFQKPEWRETVSNVLVILPVGWRQQVNFKDILLNEIKNEEDAINRRKLWILSLNDDGFDWDNTTPTQEWAIRNFTCPK